MWRGPKRFTAFLPVSCCAANGCAYPNAPEFPPLPVPQYTLLQYNFVPASWAELMHMQSLEVIPQMSGIIEEGTRDQSKCPLWFSIRRLRLTASKFYEAAHVRSESTAKTLAGRILKGAPQTKAMRRGVELEPEVLHRYAETFNVNVLPCGLIIHPKAPHLGASKDGKETRGTAGAVENQERLRAAKIRGYSPILDLAKDLPEGECKLQTCSNQREEEEEEDTDVMKLVEYDDDDDDDE
ncbi:hypothetical protein G5714_022837 [Onychostoma macrolepis]|uniref:Uncharacterized protein n=1 Tax=Onychostoma macrolepis TaxID=369639 RepID=A0A7J6BPB3_9TELE|nr:hypothetical protein G5714_022837 [Onychostoma macrolepis]